MKLIFKDEKTKHELELIYENNIKGCILNYIGNSFMSDFDHNDMDDINELIDYINNLILVKDDDDGIRPVGKPDECFYCGSKVGEHHQIDCVILTRENKYSVMVIGNSEAEIYGSADKSDKIGTLIWSDPISWDKENCEYHKNDSSWCASNALENITWLKNKNAKSVIKEIEKLDDELRCTCSLLEFKFDKSENWLGKDQRFNFIEVKKIDI